MKTVKVAEATGAVLDWLVAKYAGHLRPDGGVYAGHQGRVFHPSSDWNQGGPIIEREIHAYQRRTDYFYTSKHHPQRGWVWSYGPTLLVSGLRTVVRYYLGDEVAVPEELLND